MNYLLIKWVSYALSLIRMIETLIYYVNVPLKASLIQCTFRLTNYVVIILRGVVVFVVLFKIWYCADNLIFRSSTTHPHFGSVNLSIVLFTVQKHPFIQAKEFNV